MSSGSRPLDVFSKCLLNRDRGSKRLTDSLQWNLLPCRWRVKSDSVAAAAETKTVCSAEHGGSFPDLGRMKWYSAIVQNLVADANAFVAYVDAWPCDTCFCLGAVLTAKGAGEVGKSVPLPSWPQSHGCTPPTRARGLMIGDAPRLLDSKSRSATTGTTTSFRWPTTSRSPSTSPLSDVRSHPDGEDHE